VLLSYLQQLRGSRHPGVLGTKLAKVFDEPEKVLAEHLGKVDRTLAEKRD
jgi:hypothetical protein